MAGKVGRPRKTPVKTVDQDEPTVLDAASFEDEGDDNYAPEPGTVEETAAPVDDDAPVTQQQLAKTLQGLTQAVTVMAESQPVKRVPFAKRKIRSPFNPTGNRKRKLTRRCYQNGYPMLVTRLHDEEIALLNQVRPGLYINNLVRVTETQNGGNIDLHIIYKNKGIDQQLANQQHWRDLRDLLRLCVEETRSAPTLTSV